VALAFRGPICPELPVPKTSFNGGKTLLSSATGVPERYRENFEACKGLWSGRAKRLTLGRGNTWYRESNRFLPRNRASKVFWKPVGLAA